ncbi:hypothetical protein ACM66B_002748 [Microbotryomycetes sp. NB124-2]
MTRQDSAAGVAAGKLDVQSALSQPDGLHDSAQLSKHGGHPAVSDSSPSPNPSSGDDADLARSTPETSPDTAHNPKKDDDKQDQEAHAAILEQTTTAIPELSSVNVNSSAELRRRQSVASNASSGLKSSRPPSRPPSSGGIGVKGGSLSREPSLSTRLDSARKGHLRTSGSPDARRRSSASARPDSSHARDDHSLNLIVRDFAFPRDDPRFEGRPHPDESKRASVAAYQDDDDEPASSSGFTWGFVTSHQADVIEQGGSEQPREDEQSSEEFAFDDLGEFVPGVYEALYDFAPELETEMSIQAGEIVTVISRQCAGWVQAGRIQNGQVTGEIGLVPENYLQLLDPVDVDEPELVAEPESTQGGSSDADVEHKTVAEDSPPSATSASAPASA